MTEKFWDTLLIIEKFEGKVFYAYMGNWLP